MSLGARILADVLKCLCATEVYSTRERNGIYIPRERYFEEEAEKKVSKLPYTPKKVIIRTITGFCMLVNNRQPSKLL